MREIGKQAAIEVRRDNPKQRKSFQDTGQDECGKGRFHLMGGHRVGYGSLFSGGLPVDSLEAGEFMETERHPKLLRCRPEAVVDFRVEWQFVGWRCPDQTSRQPLLGAVF